MHIVSTIPEARAFSINQALMCGYKVPIQRGSFEGEETYRIQLPHLAIRITNHCFDRVPVPPTSDWPAEMTSSHGEAYYNKYIIGTESPVVNEVYTYASRLNQGNQLETVLDMLRRTPFTNQACFSISDPGDVWLDDPPCWRGGQFIFDGHYLHLHSWFRSHDIYAGMPENLYGLSRLLDDVSSYASLPCGSIFYYGSGSHLYSYQLDLL